MDLLGYDLSGKQLVGKNEQTKRMSKQNTLSVYSKMIASENSITDGLIF